MRSVVIVLAPVVALLFITAGLYFEVYFIRWAIRYLRRKP
jgi:hypothetical protein